MADETNASTDATTPVAVLDVTKMETSALADAREEQRVKGLAAMEDYRTTRDPRAYDAVKGHYANMDGLSAEMSRRNEMGGIDEKFKAAFTPPANVASMLGAGQGPMVVEDNTPGGLFLKSAGYKRALDETVGFTNITDRESQLRLGVDWKDTDGYLSGKHLRKALITTASASGGPFVVPFYDMSYEPATLASNDIYGLVDRTTITTDSVYWILETARAAQATAVAQASNSTGTTGTKPEATVTFSRNLGIVEVIAEVAPVTETALADAGQLASIINTDLREDLLKMLNAQMLTGTGSTPNLTGILNAGIKAATYSTSVPVASANILDNFLHMQVIIATANEPAPDAYVIEWVDWESMRLLRASGTGEYLWADAGQLNAGTLWGLPVVVTNNIPNGTALCGAFRRACRLYEREGIRFVTGWINDDLQRNIVRIRAELRACMTTRRPSAIVQLTAIP